jgi:DNA-binding NarL/FixJ family response regulator
MTTADETQDFTEQEFQVIFGMCAGLTNEEIAEGYRIAVEAVMSARASVYDKAAVSTRVELQLFARAALNAYLRRRSGR